MTQSTTRRSRCLCGLATASLLLTSPAMAASFVPDTLLKSVLYYKTKNRSHADLGGDKIAGEFLKTPARSIPNSISSRPSSTP